MLERDCLLLLKLLLYNFSLFWRISFEAQGLQEMDQKFQGYRDQQGYQILTSASHCIHAHVFLLISHFL